MKNFITYLGRFKWLYLLCPCVSAAPACAQAPTNGLVAYYPLCRTYTILNIVQFRRLLPASLCLQKRISEWFGHSTGFYCRVTHGQILFSVRILSETSFLFHNPNIRVRYSKERCNAWFSRCKGKDRTIVDNHACFFCHFSVIFSKIVHLYLIKPKMYNFVKECSIILTLLRAL
jgi:hypothetical protein